MLLALAPSPITEEDVANRQKIVIVWSTVKAFFGVGMILREGRGGKLKVPLLIIFYLLL